MERRQKAFAFSDERLAECVLKLKLMIREEMETYGSRSYRHEIYNVAGCGNRIVYRFDAPQGALHTKTQLLAHERMANRS